MRLFVGDDWVGDHHDIEVMDGAGKVLATQRLRHQLREYFPAAIEAFDDPDAPDTLELLGKAPDPGRARKLTRAQVRRHSSGPAAGTSRTGPRRSWPRCAAGSSASPTC